MICPKCHYSVRESDLFCGHCGCFLEKAGQGENRSGLSSKEEQEGMLDKFIGIDGRVNRKKYIFRSLLLWGMGCIFELCVIMSRVEQLDLAGFHGGRSAGDGFTYDSGNPLDDADGAPSA